MADFGMVKSFDIDNGELDGLRSNECFVLGYELAQIDMLAENGGSFERPVHANNEARIRKSLEGRDFSLAWMKDDVSESWMWLEVR